MSKTLRGTKLKSKVPNDTHPIGNKFKIQFVLHVMLILNMAPMHKDDTFYKHVII